MYMYTWPEKLQSTKYMPEGVTLSHRNYFFQLPETLNGIPGLFFCTRHNLVTQSLLPASPDQSEHTGLIGRGGLKT